MNCDLSNIKILGYDLPHNCFFSDDDVFDGLTSLRNTKSIGPDGLSGLFLFKVRHSISFPLWLLFRRSLDEGNFPDIWKLCSITSVLKSGDASLIFNYRPISILSHIAKLFESLVLNNIQPSANILLMEKQHGFRSGRSTTTCNAVFCNYIFEAFKAHSQVDVIFTDFCKAFDRVDHYILQRVLQATGFGEPLLLWFCSFIDGRKQFVITHGVSSDILIISSGVPQGGHLSPLLFSVFLNSINHSLNHARLLAFADDLKIFYRINSLNDCHVLQDDLNAIVVWTNKLGLDFNIAKCHHMTFTHLRYPIHFKYAINGTRYSAVT